MTRAMIDERAPLRLRPLRVVPDANIFARADWIEPLALRTSEGHTVLYWLPKTVEEVGRVHVWIWLKKVLRQERLPRGSSGWKALWRRYSEEAHRWFARVSPFVTALEDRPPHEVAWTDPAPDPNDAWLWNAARRIDTDAVITLDLREVPDANAVGVQHHEGIIFAEPRTFVMMLHVWNRIHATGIGPVDLVQEMLDATDPSAVGHARLVAAMLQHILGRMSNEGEAAPIEISSPS